MPSINAGNAGGLVDGRIPAGKACPFLKTCSMKVASCPTKQESKSIAFSCAAARAHALLLISDSSILRKIFQKDGAAE